MPNSQAAGNFVVSELGAVPCRQNCLLLTREFIDLFVEFCGIYRNFINNDLTITVNMYSNAYSFF